MDLEGRISVVTGGASGMGAAVVKQLADIGAVPVVWDRADGADVVVDVSDPAAVESALAETVSRWGVPTLLTICAAIGDSAPLLQASPDLWDRVLDINLKGAFLTMKAVAGALVEAGEPGSIVVFSSISARLSDRGMGPYCAAKAGLDMLVKVAASEWGVHGIRVNAVAPGVTATPMLTPAARLPGWLDAVAGRTPLGTVGEPDAVASAAVALHRLDWVTGESLAADGGLRLHSPIDSFGQAQALLAGRS